MEFMLRARQLDLLEVYYATGVSFNDSLLQSMGDVKALIDDDENVYAIGGFDNHNVWMLCTDLVETNKILFLRSTKKVLQDVMKKEGYLKNYVWLGNDLHIKWLKWMGAEFEEPIYYGYDGQPFKEFYFKPKGCE
jgi:hypothetical protein|nr:MAG TPA: internal virion protein A [Caudoviricetes sp.]